MNELGKIISEYKAPKFSAKELSSFITGCFSVLLGVIYKFVPPVNKFISGLFSRSSSPNNTIWVVLVFIGVWNIFNVLKQTNKNKNVTIYENGITINSQDEHYSFLFPEIDHISQSERKKAKMLNISSDGNQIQIFNFQIINFDKFAHELQKKQAKCLLRDKFPNKIDELNIPFGSKLKLVNGIFSYDNEDKFPVSDISNYTKEEKQVFGKTDITIYYGKKSISLLSEEISNRYALIKILDHAIKQNK